MCVCVYAHVYAHVCNTHICVTDTRSYTLTHASPSSPPTHAGLRPLHLPVESHTGTPPATLSRAPSTPPTDAPSEAFPPNTASSTPDALTPTHTFADAAAHVHITPPTARHTPATAAPTIGRPSTSSSRDERSSHAPSSSSQAPSASLPHTPFYPPTPSHPEYSYYNGLPTVPSSTPPSSSFVSSEGRRPKSGYGKDKEAAAAGLATAGSMSSELHVVSQYRLYGKGKEAAACDCWQHTFRVACGELVSVESLSPVRGQMLRAVLA